MSDMTTGTATQMPGTAPAPTADKMKRVEFAGYAAGNLGFILQNSLVASYMILFWTTVGQMPALILGTMTLICRFVDAFTDIGFGLIGDRTHTRLGSYKPWFMSAMIPSAICFFLLFFVPGVLRGDIAGSTIWVYAFYLLWGSVFTTINFTSLGSFNVIQTSNVKDRRFMSFLRQWSGSIGGFLISLLAMPLLLLFGNGETTTQTGYVGMVGIFAVASAILFTFCAFTTKERIPVNPGKKVPIRDTLRACKGNYLVWGVFIVNMTVLMISVLVNGLTAFYFTYYMGDPTLLAPIMALSSGIGVVFTTVVTPIIIRKMKRNSYYLMAAIIMIAGMALMYLSAGQPIAFAIGMIMFFTMVSVAGIFVYQVIPDAADYGEWKSGVAVPGGINALVSFGQKISMGVGTFVVTAVLAVVGFDETATVQSAATGEGIRIAYSLLPIICILITLIGWALIRKIKDSEMDKVRADLAVKREKEKAAVEGVPPSDETV